MTPTPPPPSDPTTTLSKPILTLPNNITIRPYRTPDAAPSAHHANNRAIWLNMADTFPHPYTLKEAHDWIAMQLDPTKMWHTTSPPWADADTKAATRIPYNYVIALNDEAIGGIGLKFGTDVGSRTLEFGYWLGDEHWGKGITSSAGKAFLDWTFETFPYIVRISAKVYHRNKASMRVCEKCGMERESVMRAAVFKDGTVGDLICYVRLRKGLEY